jgi:arginase
MAAGSWFLLGAPWDSSGSGRGEQAAPAALRAAGLARLVDRDLGDAATTIAGTHRDDLTGVRALAATLTAADVLAARLTAAMSSLPRHRPLVVGGDCSILLGILPALRVRGPVGLWFLDGHPDFADGSTSDTGETADMELAVLTGVGAAPLTALGGPEPLVPAERVVLMGHRTVGLDAASAAETARLPPALRRIDAATLVADPAAAARNAEAWLSAVDGPLWLHVDLDVLDPGALPAVTYPQPGGPGWGDVAAVLAPLARSPRLAGVSVADFRPDLDPGGDLAARVVALLADVLPGDAAQLT